MTKHLFLKDSSAKNRLETLRGDILIIDMYVYIHLYINKGLFFRYY